jgi:hypothetical protein
MFHATAYTIAMEMGISNNFSDETGSSVYDWLKYVCMYVCMYVCIYIYICIFAEESRFEWSRAQRMDQKVVLTFLIRWRN